LWVFALHKLYITIQKYIKPSSSLTAPINPLSPATLYDWRVAAWLFLAGFMDRQGGALIHVAAADD
jgi:hypothetical protein